MGRFGQFAVRPLPAPRAVTAVHGAHVGGDEEAPVGVSVDEPFHRHVPVFRQGIAHPHAVVSVLGHRRRRLLTDRVFGIRGIDEAEVVGGNADVQLRLEELELLEFGTRIGQELRQGVQVFDAVLVLPTPIVPLFISGVGKELWPPKLARRGRWAIQHGFLPAGRTSHDALCSSPIGENRRPRRGTARPRRTTMNGSPNQECWIDWVAAPLPLSWRVRPASIIAAAKNNPSCGVSRTIRDPQLMGKYRPLVRFVKCPTTPWGAGII